MKTNMMTKCILGVLAVLTVCLFFMPAFAADETQAAETVPAENSRPGKEHKPGKHERPKKGGDSFDDRFEDWFEDRIEALENTVDFSELPDEPTEADMVEFFKKFFMGDTETSAEAVKEKDQKHGNKPSGEDRSREGRPGGKGFGKGKKHEDPRAEQFEDWFEDRIESRQHDVDFSELPENPTEEEMVEFFKKYFMDGDAVVNFGEHEGHKGPHHPKKQEAAPETEAVSETEAVPETETAPEAAAPQENIDAAPAEEQPAEETDSAA